MANCDSSQRFFLLLLVESIDMDFVEELWLDMEEQSDGKGWWLCVLFLLLLNIFIKDKE
jgi:hypothetical protein